MHINIYIYIFIHTYLNVLAKPAEAPRGFDTEVHTNFLFEESLAGRAKLRTDPVTQLLSVVLSVMLCNLTMMFWIMLGKNLHKPSHVAPSP